MRNLPYHVGLSGTGTIPRMVLIIGLVLGSLIGTGGASYGAAQTEPTLHIDAPRQVDVGEPIVLRLTLFRAGDIAGYETRLLFDTSAAEFDELQQRKNDLKKLGRDISPLTVSDLPDGAAIGLYSCSVENCVVNQGPSQDTGGRGTIKLATVSLIPTQPGQLEIAFDEWKFVDATGASISVSLDQQPIVVQVGPVGTGKRYPAPARRRQLPVSTTASGPFDLTGDGQVTHADAMEAAIAWTVAREHGLPCGPTIDLSRDMNQDGCIDVADLQSIAARYSSRTASAAALEVTGLTFTVNSTSDSADANAGNGICATSSNVCTLRAAIQEANLHAGADTIAFNIPGTGVQTIQLGGQLPTLNDTTGATTIDGYTQPGSSPNSDLLISNAILRVQIRGGGPSAYDAFVITSAGNLIRGLALYNLRHGFWLQGSNATGNSIVGNFIGTDAAGNFAFTSETSSAHGIQLTNGPARNTFGGVSPAERNVISGNAAIGISTFYETTDNNRIVNNIIGLGPKGDKRLSNRKHGVDINSGSAYNQIGGTEPGERNLISGNVQNGVELSHGTTTVNNRIVGNYLGTSANGTSVGAAFTYNSGYGVQIEDGATNNLVSNNVIGNSRLGGIHLESYNTIANQITKNRIGIDIDGNAIPNGSFGIQIAYRVSRIQIGPDNIIANNPEGIQIPNPENDYNTITRNSIYNNSGRGIDLQPLDPVNRNVNDAGDTDSGANEQLNYPVLTSATPYQVQGTACAESIVPKPCTVEVFLADRGAGAYGQGQTFVGAATTSSTGSFTAYISGANVGDYVTATATDANGNTSEFSTNHVVTTGSPPPSPTATPTALPDPLTTYASDSFTRNVTGGWGSAEIGGGYALEAPTRPASDYDVNGTAGTIAVPTANQWHSVYLTQVSALDVDLTFQVQTDKITSGGYHFVYAVARHVGAGTQYLARIGFDPNRKVLLQAAKSNPQSITLLGTQVGVPGLTQTANSPVWLRTQVVGTNPTTIRLKAWGDGQAEPSTWLYTVTDSEPDLQAPGAVGLRNYVSSSNTNLPIRFTFDDFRATSIRAAASPPTLTPTPTPTPPVEPGIYVADTFTRNVTDGWGSSDTGGAYTLAGTAADFDVTGTAGTISTAANATRSAHLAGVSAQDVDLVMRVQTNKLVEGGSQMIYAIARRTGSGTNYLGRLRRAMDGSVRLQAVAEVAGSATLLGSEVVVAGLSHTANRYVWLRMEASGTNPTTLRLKAWADDQPEPATWLYTVSDSTAALQAPGAVGIRSYLSSAATNGPVLFTVDDLRVIDASTP